MLGIKPVHLHMPMSFLCLWLSGTSQTSPVSDPNEYKPAALKSQRVQDAAGESWELPFCIQRKDQQGRTLGEQSGP